MNPSDVRSIASLARLHVDEAELPHLVSHFERMLGFVASLSEVDVTGVEPELHEPRSSSLLRADVVREAGTAGGPLPRDGILANAPDHEGPYFVTPRVV